MSKKNLIDEINARIDALNAEKAAAVAQIEGKMIECAAAREAAIAAQEQAKKDLDAEAYQAAAVKLTTLEVQQDMYEGRYKDVTGKKLVTEEDSDAVIQSILDYEQAAANAYIESIKPALRTLRGLTADYLDDIQRAEGAILRWTADIHPNYHNFGAAYTDPETGVRSDKNGMPHPVHRIPYHGCAEADRVDDFFRRFPEMLTED